jgi:hypothetical protein
MSLAAVMGRFVKGLIAGRSPVKDGVALAVILLVVASYASGFLSAKPGYIGSDLRVCQREAQAWLGGAPMYPAFEVGGPFQVAASGLILYPPVTFLLLVLTLLLPLPLWWLIPAAVVGAVVYRMRPRGVWLLALGFCLAYPVSVALVVTGNPDIWLAAALAIAVYWKPAAAFVLLKPSVFPLALVGARSRGWWVVAGVFAVVSLALLPQTLDWLTVIRNGQGGYGLRSGLTYSVQDLPLLSVPLVTWAGSGRGVRPWLSKRRQVATAAELGSGDIQTTPPS